MVCFIKHATMYVKTIKINNNRDNENDKNSENNNGMATLQR